ncbi:hypothetical protein DVH24_022574 [Malus domestica]|uniref:Uncharacterized protein n=1 Tax=Malus domestica TaxID=3750 RepID=A0A498KJQ1_MALDO|nr:hypothetical protein DVH24_022574 [Malus domestica]
MLQFLITYKNLILQLSVSLTLTLLLTFLKIPIFFLRGLHTYIHPDNVQSGVRAAIRRPDGPDSASGQPSKSNPELRKRSRSNPNPSSMKTMLRSSASSSTRPTSKPTCISMSIPMPSLSPSLQFHLSYLNNESDDKNSGFLVNGVFVPVLLGFAGVSKLLILHGKIAYEISASRRSEKQLSVLLGAAGLVLGNVICFTFSPKFIDFHLESVDGFAKMFIAVLMGCFSGFLFIPAVKSARCFWLGSLLLLGLSQIDGISSENYQYICSLSSCSALVKEVALFMAWWILFVWTIYSSATIFLYRRCILYVS